jgi:putative endonuclease
MAYYVYILTNKASTVLYTGVTGNLPRRAYEHREELIDGFSKRYNVQRLVYYEGFEDVFMAIEREKAIKGGSRKRKMALVDAFNPTWRDLFYELG